MNGNKVWIFVPLMIYTLAVNFILILVHGYTLLHLLAGCYSTL